MTDAFPPAPVLEAKTVHLDADSSAIARAQNGEREAFGEIYDRYLDLIFRYVRARVATEQDAEDLTEQVFLRSFESIDRYMDRGVPYSAFLYQVARNAIADHYRHPVEAPIHDESALPLVNGNGHDNRHDRRVDELRSALAELPPDYQEVIRLRLLMDLPVAAVAKWMDRSEGAVRVLHYRALRSLREKINYELEF